MSSFTNEALGFFQASATYLYMFKSLSILCLRFNQFLVTSLRIINIRPQMPLGAAQRLINLFHSGII
jgi:hypothetical protein